MNLSIIAAISGNNVIGLNGNMIWKISEDMKHFKNLTINHPVIMGRITYESISIRFRPLDGRKNIILSRSLESTKNIYIARNLQEAIDLTEGKDSYIMGGSEIYKLFLPIVNKMEITRVHKNYLGDSYFPSVNWDEWDLVKEENFFNSKIPYSFLSYERK